ncbi:MAG TPA: hypothetical protein VKA12_12855, partial [Roseiarcus sp.]|nr:hypothetical protein [Roseiarcus sp.]
TRTHGREKVVGAWAPALAIEAEGGDAAAAPFTRARSALHAETPPRALKPGEVLIFRVSMLPTRRRGLLRRFLRQGWTKGSESGGAGEIDFAALKQEARARLAASKRGA